MKSYENSSSEENIDSTKCGSVNNEEFDIKAACENCNKDSPNQDY